MSFIIDGNVYEDEFQWYASRMGLESPTEPVDALKLQEGRVVAPPKIDAPEPSKRLEDSIPQKKTFDNDWNRMVDDIIAASPKWRGDKNFTQSPNFEDRRDKPIDSTPVNPSVQDVKEFYGDDINPKEFVMDPLAHEAGVNRLNEMIVRKESSPKNKPRVIELDPNKPKDDIDQLLEKLDKWKKKK